MSTFSYSGITVTSSGGTVSAIGGATISFVATDEYGFKYTVAGAANATFATATLTNFTNNQLYALNVNGTRINPTGNIAIAEYGWTEGGAAKSAVIMRVPTGAAGEYAYIVLEGDALPSFSDVATYNSFIAGLTSFTSTQLNTDNRYIYPSVDAPIKSQHDLITGGFGDNWSVTALSTGLGNDTVTGLAAKDIIFAGVGDDSIGGLAGNDVIDLGGGHDKGFGGLGDDSMLGGAGNDSILGDAGNDTIRGGEGNDTLVGADGNDLTFGDLGADTIWGGDGNDTVHGGAGADTLSGADGNDVLRGGIDNDSLYGGFDDDRLFGEAGNDYLYGDHGNDMLDGGFGNDVLDGHHGADSIYGSYGNDLLQGGDGADILGGGDGTDTLRGEAGADTLTGAAGADFFVFAAGDGADLVNDFRNDVDTLRLSHATIDTWAELKAAATQQGANVVLDLGDGDIITLKNFTLNNLENDVAFF